MKNNTRSIPEILDKLKISALNPMQEEALQTVTVTQNCTILSPTGTGKTLAFLLPIISLLQTDANKIQVLILVPSRELALQIEQVARSMGSGLKINAFYGGRAFVKDTSELQTPPTILIGTPGRIADHLDRGTIDGTSIAYLVLDEFDKSLEVGFEQEMKLILKSLPSLKKRVLTSATAQLSIPKYVGMDKNIKIDYLHNKVDRLQVFRVVAPTKDKLGTLELLLRHIGTASGIIFCNYKDTIQFVSDFLTKQNIPHGTFYGGMEQRDRERALIKFRNKTHTLLLATDLAARGIDIPALDFIIHYQLPLHATEFTHRNGRTARMQESGAAYALQWEEENVPDFAASLKMLEPRAKNKLQPSPWTTLFLSGGRKDKISKGDIAGFFIKEGKLNSEDLGIIELKSDCAFVAITKHLSHTVVPLVDNKRLKRKKVRVYGV